MTSPFELFIARRYLRAKRKQVVISVITAISIIGVAAGVMALIIALAINNGFRSTLQRTLLGATAHVSVLEKEPGEGIANWRDVVARVERLPHVTSAAATLYGGVYLSGAVQSSNTVLKGINPESQVQMQDLAKHLKQGSLDDLRRSSETPALVLGSRLAERTGTKVGNFVTLMSANGEMTPFGPRPSYHLFRIAGLVESGFYDLDLTWAFARLDSVQRVLGLNDVVNSIELKLDDIELAPEVAAAAEKTAGPKLSATHWKEQNRQLVSALRMEKTVTTITISLIQLVAALNILITLVMMVMEKNRDIAILLSLGARREQIRNIFVLEGVLIGVVGTAIGLIVGHALCYFADRGRWVPLDEEIYSLSFVPFEPIWTDTVWVAAAAILVSFLATLYPARGATRVAPAEALRYE